jgi:hypothetical protein
MDQGLKETETTGSIILEKNSTVTSSFEKPALTTSPSRKSVKVISYTLPDSSSVTSFQPAVCAPIANVMPGSPNILRVDTSVQNNSQPHMKGRFVERASFNIPELHSPSGK